MYTFTAIIVAIYAAGILLLVQISQTMFLPLFEIVE